MRRAGVLRDLLETVGSVDFAVTQWRRLRRLCGGFSTQALSLGSLSPEAHKLWRWAESTGGGANTGEGGERSESCTRRPEAVEQIMPVLRDGSALPRIIWFMRGIEIKMAQGQAWATAAIAALKVTELIGDRHATRARPDFAVRPSRQSSIEGGPGATESRFAAVNSTCANRCEAGFRAGVGIMRLVWPRMERTLFQSAANWGTGSSPAYVH